MSLDNKRSFGLPDYLFKSYGHSYHLGSEEPLSDSTLKEIQRKNRELFEQIYPAQALFQASLELLGKSRSFSKELGEEKNRIFLEVTKDAPSELSKRFPRSYLGKGNC